MKQRGFTLIEFVVYTALTAMVLVFLFQLLFGIITNQARSQAKEAVMDNATRAMATIDSELRHAERVYTDDLNKFNTTSTDHLSLVTDKDLSGGENWTYVELYKNADNRLCVKSEREGVRCVTSEEVEVTGLDFEKVLLNAATTTAAGIKTTITVEFNDPLEKAPFTLNSFSRLRSF